MPEPLSHPDQPPAYVVGLVADTHIPDRVSELHPLLTARLREAGVCQILHAGDIATRRVLNELSLIAPVTAVRGNRDVLAGPLNLVEEIEVGGVRVALTHGHGGFTRYLIDKVAYYRFGYRLERYLPLLSRAGRAAKVVVFGHTHYPLVRWEAGKLLFNPGSASFGTRMNTLPSFGLLRIWASGEVAGEVIHLEGYEIKNRRWVKTD